MIEPVPWLERDITFDQPVGLFPAILERLRGTPTRAAELVAGLPEKILSQRLNGKWSVKEHPGHLADLQLLDDKRLREFQNEVAVLSAADTTNRTTEEGTHRETPIAEILAKMRTGRKALVQEMELLTNDQIAVAAIHPRLRKNMRLVDWAYFVAEHDDHHLAHIAKATRELRMLAHSFG